jgi:hypothetical protein
MRCKQCRRGNLRKFPIAKYRDNGGYKNIGREIFCMNPNCNFQRDIK